MARTVSLKGHLDCIQCPLHKTRIQVVPGYGNPKSHIVVVGEAPGAEEDAAGRPFVGQAGQLLRAIIADAGLDPSELFFTNTYHCRPPDNKIEHAKGSPCPDIWLWSELRTIKPSVIIACGKTAITYFWPHTQKILMRDLVNTSDLLSEDGIEAYVIATYHPSYAVRMGTDDWDKNFAIREIRDTFLAISGNPLYKPLDKSD